MASLLELADTLSSIRRITADELAKVCSTLDRPPKKDVFLKALRDAAVALRKSGKYGRLRSIVLIGLTCDGHDALLELENGGVFLSNGEDRRKFLTFLERLAQDVQLESQWSLLGERISTYRAYAELVEQAKSSLTLLKQAARQPIRHWVKQLFCLVEIAFGRSYFHVDPPPAIHALLDGFSSAEEVASAVSLAVATANEVRPLDAMDISMPTIGTLDAPALRELLHAAQLLFAIKEISHYLCAFSYSLRWEGGNGVAAAIMTPPNPEFERSVQLGFIRGQLGKGQIAMDMMEMGLGSRPTLADAARHFAQLIGKELYEIADPYKPYRRVRLHLPMSPHLVTMLDGGYFADELNAVHGLTQDFLLPLKDEDSSSPSLTGHLNYTSLSRMFRFLRFYAMVNSVVCAPFATSDFTAFQNSLVRIVRDCDLRSLLGLLGESEEAINAFIHVIAADVEELGHYDLQYSPLVKIRKVPIPELPNPETEYLLLPSIMIASNETRNSQIRTRTRFHRDGKGFVRAVREELATYFPYLVTEKKLQLGDLKTEVDIALLCGSKLYLIECKHSLTATSPHEMRDLWRDIKKGRNQVIQAKFILSNEERRLAYVRQWFPHLSKEAALALPVVCAILSSHRLFSGLDDDGIAVRDYASLSRLLENGELGISYTEPDGTVYKKSFRIREQEQLTCADLEDYFSPRSRFHRMQFHAMKEQQVFQRIGHLMLVRESFAYEIDSTGWVKYMRDEGYLELPEKTIPVSASEVLPFLEDVAK